VPTSAATGLILRTRRTGIERAIEVGYYILRAIASIGDTRRICCAHPTTDAYRSDRNFATARGGIAWFLLRHGYMLSRPWAPVGGGQRCGEEINTRGRIDEQMNRREDEAEDGSDC